MVDMRRGSSRSDDGAAAVEYAILVMLIAVVIVLAVAAIGFRTLGNFQGVLPPFVH